MCIRGEKRVINHGWTRIYTDRMFGNLIMSLIEEELSHEVIGACMQVSNELGIGFLESVYHRALLVELEERNIKYTSQMKLKVIYKNIIVGDFIADVVIDDKIILELKAAKAISKEMEAQVINYLKATGIKIGYIINFGNRKLEWKRYVL